MNLQLTGISRRVAAALKPLCARFALLTMLCFSCGPSIAWAGDAAAGKIKAQACIVCHGAMGLSQAPNTPNLAGQPDVYLLQQLKLFRNGKRQNEVMAVIAKGLSDTDIDDLASWFASIQIGLK